MKKNDVVIVLCENFGSNGEGIARADGVTLFVPDLLPGERAQVRILKRTGSIGYGRVEELLSPAEERVRPRCAVYRRCGGCQLQHLRYRDQLRFKTTLVSEALRKIAGIRVPVAPCVGSEKDYGYRNKLQLPVGSRGGETVIGFYAERSHRIVECEDCPIHPEWAGKAIAALSRFMEKCGLDGYDEETGEGQIRHLVVRELKGKFLVTLVTTEPELKGIDYLLFLFDSVFREYSFYLNRNTARTNVVFGEEFTLLKGPGKYECSEEGIVFEAGAETFLQVNDGVRSKLYALAVNMVGAGETVVDCYAGGGLLTAMFAKKCGRAYGIEVVPEASACAVQLARRNGLEERMISLCGRVEERLACVLDEAERATVVLDPPRAGVSRAVLREIASRGVNKIVMISCNPATLARDLGILTGSLRETERGELIKEETPQGAYEITLVQPFDMFPQTKHVETLVLLERKNHNI